LKNYSSQWSINIVNISHNRMMDKQVNKKMTITELEQRIATIEFNSSYTERLVKNALARFRELFPKKEEVSDLLKWIIISGPTSLKITEQQMLMTRGLVVDITTGCVFGAPIVPPGKIKDEWHIRDLDAFLLKKSVALGDHETTIKSALARFRFVIMERFSTTANFISFLRTNYDAQVLKRFVRVLKH